MTDRVHGEIIRKGVGDNVYVTYSYTDSADNTEKTDTDYYAVQGVEEGTPYIEYIDNDGVTKLLDLPCYDSNIATGDPIPREVGYAYVGTLKNAFTFFGESSDEYPLFTFDVVIKQGTPVGDYTIDFDWDVTKLTDYSSGKPMQADDLASFTISVTNKPPEETETTTTTEATTTTETTTTSETVIYQPDPLLLETEKTLYVGESAEITVYNAEDCQVVWMSHDPDVLSIVEESADSTATIRGVSPGTTTLIALVGNGSTLKMLMCEVTVLPAESMSIQSTSILCGDVNCDGYVALNDVILLMKYTGRFVEFEDSQLENAECNGDGQVNANDALVLLKFLSQKIDSLPYDG